MKKTQLALMLLVAMALVSCKKQAAYGDLSVNIGYSVNGKPLVTDSLCYHNEAGNAFMITEIQWFISNMELQNEQGEWIALEHSNDNNATNKYFYIDTNIPESQTINISPIPVGKYNALRFTFGLNEEDNLSGIYSDPPESNMFWPEMLGGGYHYMKLNGRYINTDGDMVPLNVHLGIGQNEEHSEYFQNFFTIEGPIDLSITENQENCFDLCMIVDNWFRNPNLYDFNTYGSAIMQNQAAQQALKENGRDVFTWKNTEKQNNKAMKKEEISQGFCNIMQKAAPKPHFWTLENLRQSFEQIKENKKDRS